MSEGRDKLDPQRSKHKRLCGSLDGPLTDREILIICVLSLYAVRYF